MNSPVSAPTLAAKKKLHARLTAAKKQAESAKQAMKQAKAKLKLAKQECKVAKRVAKKRRKEFKALKAERAALTAKRPVEKPAATRTVKRIRPVLKLVAPESQPDTTGIGTGPDGQSAGIPPAQ